MMAAENSIETPRVTISEISGGVPRRPMAMTPTSTPTAPHTTTVTASPTTCGSRPASSEADSIAPSTASDPCAKLTTRVTRCTTTKPLPISANEEPRAIPVTR